MFMTTSILLSKNIFVSFLIFVSGLVLMIAFYNLNKLRNFLLVLKKFRMLFLTLVIFQLLTRSKGEIYYSFYFLRISSDGVFYAFSSLFRYLVILLSATMLGSASPYEMIKALRTMKIPEVIVILVSFTIQFLRQFQLDFKIIMQNLEKRNIHFTFKDDNFINAMKKRFEVISHLVIPVLGKTMSDIKYKVIAMELNAYGLKKAHIVNFRYIRCSRIDYLIIVLFCLFYVSVLIFLQ